MPGTLCGCCSGLTLSTPVIHANRPGLPAIAYRVGSHPLFRASLLARLATSDHLALRQLATLQDDDVAIALCDAWATVGDVLTFYQERIANEGFLRTATERRSVSELARLIDYALRPGVAASAHLAFNLETALGAPDEVVIPSGTKVMSIPGPEEKPQTFETVADVTARGSWNQFQARSKQAGSLSAFATSVTVAGTALGVRPGDRLLFMGETRRLSAASNDWETRVVSSAVPSPDGKDTVISWTGALPSLSQPARLFVFRQHAALFGHNAPDPRVLAERTVLLMAAQIKPPPTGQTVGTDWIFVETPGEVSLDAIYDRVNPNGYVLLMRAGAAALHNINAVRIHSRSAYTLSSRVTKLEVQPTALTSFHGDFLRSTTVHVQSELLPLADVPVTQPVAGEGIVLDRAILGLLPGHRLLIEGVDADSNESTGEVVTLLRTESVGNVSRIVFTNSLSRHYRADTVRVRGNVAPATHGETVREVLGSGDGAQSFQHLRLRQPPLTWVPAPGGSGAASTLELRVNGIRWHELRSLYGAGPSDRVFTTRVEDDGSTIAEFGDGEHGARLPTGRENVSATYRKGIGLAGLLRARQLSQPLTPPLGVREVTNPLPTAGAEDPESVDAARRNCTLTIHTLDRVVSLLDYEDFARAYAGIAKSLATWFWDGKRRGVFLTIAGPDGALISNDAVVRSNLLTSLRDRGEPYLPLDARSYRKGTFGVRIAVAVEPDRLKADVHALVRDALVTRYGFAETQFRTAVTVDGVLGVVQSVQGVMAANILRLNRSGQAGVEPRLLPADAVPTGAAPLGAELLTLDPLAVELTDLA